MRTCFYTICDTSIQANANNSRNLDFMGFMNSFSHFHPDIEMKVFDQHNIGAIGLNYLNAKATFGRMLSEHYDLVVNVDADHYFFARLDEILKADYDIACPANFNETDNLVGIKVSSGINGDANHQFLVTLKMFLQGGLIASPSKEFWKHYEHATLKYWDKFHCAENDILNLCAYLNPYKVKVLDGNTDFNSPEHTCWYGCGIINKESKAYIESGQIMCEGKPVKAYHFAHGGAKRKYTEIFSPEVCETIKTLIS